MSFEALQAFRATMASDPDLRTICIEAAARGDAQRVVDAAATRGLSFTVAELEALLTDGELSDVELELVAGGSSRSVDGGKPFDPHTRFTS